jgi:hypothetical protein
MPAVMRSTQDKGRFFAGRNEEIVMQPNPPNKPNPGGENKTPGQQNPQQQGNIPKRDPDQKRQQEMPGDNRQGCAGQERRDGDAALAPRSLTRAAELER